MPIPLQGLVAVGEYGSKFEADVAVAALRDSGVEATASYDPALNSVASYMASNRVVEVLVRVDDLDRASVVLGDLELGESSLPPAFQKSAVGAGDDLSEARIASRIALRRAVIIAIVVVLLTPLWLGLVATLTGH